MPMFRDEYWEENKHSLDNARNCIWGYETIFCFEEYDVAKSRALGKTEENLREIARSEYKKLEQKYQTRCLRPR